eukprot:Hpha_TRINITY_DN5654_c0_g1::TRINITY_DN5654_c0_g1_i1::g.50732::m.50732
MALRELGRVGGVHAGVKTLAALCVEYACRGGRDPSLRRAVGSLHGLGGEVRDVSQLPVFACAVDTAAWALSRTGLLCPARTELQHLLLAQYFNGFTISD